jgi:uncharacterized protein with GYD domain
MSFYLLQESLSSETWASIVEGTMNPHPLSDTEKMKAGIEHVGGKLHGLWLSIINCELVFLVEMPNSADVASFTIRNLARGNNQAIRITPLLSPEEGMKAVAMASSLPKAYKIEGDPR